jgi:hypothetical protein
LEAAYLTLQGAHRFSELILRNVRGFLGRRGLEYFKGFAEKPDLPTLGSDEGFFYGSKGPFEGFNEVNDLEIIQIEKAGWALGALTTARDWPRNLRQFASSIPIPVS